MCVQIRECPQDAPYLAAPAAILESVDTIAQPDIGRAHRLYGYVNAIQDRVAEAVEGVTEALACAAKLASSGTAVLVRLWGGVFAALVRRYMPAQICECGLQTRRKALTLKCCPF